MIKLLRQHLVRARSLQKINMSVSRGGAAAALRSVSLSSPPSWQFSGFSQNGEDGILQILLQNLLIADRYFIEIGTSDGLENNTSWLAIVERFSGLCIEGDSEKSARHQDVFRPMNYGISFLNLFVTKDSVATLVDQSATRTPDLFSLDIDGNDYHIARAVLAAGLRPRIVVVEYNSAFGPDLEVTVPYRPDFAIGPTEADRLYYGCSVAGWRRLFAAAGYEFVTVDTNGVNAFFIDPAGFSDEFVTGLSGVPFAENMSQKRIHRSGWEAQYPLIADRDLMLLEDDIH